MAEPSGQQRFAQSMFQVAGAFGVAKALSEDPACVGKRYPAFDADKWANSIPETSGQKTDREGIKSSLQGLIDVYYENKSDSGELLYVTVYNAQVAAIRKMLGNGGPKDAHCDLAYEMAKGMYQKSLDNLRLIPQGTFKQKNTEERDQQTSVQNQDRSTGFERSSIFCRNDVALMKKLLTFPIKLDDVERRDDIICEERSAVVTMVYLDTIVVTLNEEQKKLLTSSPDFDKGFKNHICTSENQRKLLEYVDLVKRSTYQGKMIREIRVKKSDCSAIPT